MTHIPPILTITLPDATTFEMVRVEGGTFMRGDIHGDGDEDSRPTHQVQLDGFYIGRYPVTQELWRSVAQSKAGKSRKIEPEPFRFKGSNRLPAESISWNQITQDFLPVLNKMTGRNFLLPTEAQWEYAARGGKHHKDGYRFAGSDKLKEVGWLDKNSGNKTQEVGQKYPNQLGLYDMSGNVWEWCADHWDADFYKTCAAENEKTGKPVLNPIYRDGSRRVLRGGSYWDEDRHCSVAIRSNLGPTGRYDLYGFRLLLQFGA